MFGYVIKSCIHSSCALNSVRVRFAPSPTGYIHLGGLRTALYNFLFAKSNNGTFILRLEDTDQKRLVPGAAKQLEYDLEWMGLVPHESPLRGGSHGPYTQSERLHIYKHYVQELLKSGHAYLCFCTDRRLELLKKDAAREGQIPRYDNRCRHLTQTTVNEKLRQGLPHCVRFKLEPLGESINDIIYGPTDLNAAEQEGDPVILKQDGFPTYHLACVVDDHLMEITHVLRGTEWLVSTVKHVLLYKAFQWKPPQFAHLPLIVNSDGTKLSKRQNDIQLEHFRSQGYYPEAIINLLCLVGGGFPSLQSNLSTLEELASLFQLERINTHSGRLDMLRLERFNTAVLKIRVTSSVDLEDMISQLTTVVQETMNNSGLTILDEEMLRKENLEKIIRWTIDEGRIHRIKQLVEPEFAFLWNKPATKINSKIDPVISQQLLLEIIHWLQEGNRQEVLRGQVTDVARKTAAKYGVQFSDFMKLLRSSLTGLKEGPSVGEIMEVLGRTICIRRLEQSLCLLK